MKKTKFLALALAAGIMMMGAGYAYWSETLTIDNTVKTGKLDFEFNDPGIVVSEYMADTSSCVVKEGDDNQVDIVLEDMYPGAEATVKFDLKNTGTMKAKVKNFDVPETFDEKPYILVKSAIYDGADLVTGTNPIRLDDLATALDTAKIEIEPGNEKHFQITFKIDPYADEDDVAENLGLNNDAIEFSITATGTQYNNNDND